VEVEKVTVTVSMVVVVAVEVLRKEELVEW
jgi:hypothetical protein